LGHFLTQKPEAEKDSGCGRCGVFVRRACVGSGGRIWKAWAGFEENGKYSRSRNVYFRITKHLIYEHKII
jgi:hypothetical protein